MASPTSISSISSSRWTCLTSRTLDATERINRADSLGRFWSQNPENDRFQVEYQERRWAGYKSLLACLRRALDEGIPVTTPSFWLEDNTPNEMFEHAFRSATNEDMPLLQDRVAMLRHAGEELSEVGAIYCGPSAENADFVEFWRARSRWR